MRAGSNLGLCVGRAGQVIGTGLWDIVFITAFAVDLNLFRRGGAKLFPLYKYSTSKRHLYSSKRHLYSDQSQNVMVQSKTSNLSELVIEKFEDCIDLLYLDEGGGDLTSTYGPEDIFGYIYAILHSKAYRSRYSEFLKTDFPRIPLTSNQALFIALVQSSRTLIDLHINLEARRTNCAEFQASGSNRINKIQFTPHEGKNGLVWINENQCFENLDYTTWNFTIGGYRPAVKWLKDRKGRTLSFDEIQHYCKLCAVLKETGQIMDKIDKIIDQHGSWPI